MNNVSKLLFFLALALAGMSAQSAKPDIDPTYVDGNIYYMIGTHTVPNANTTQPHLYATAEELYLLVYPQLNPRGTNTDPLALPSGYHPNCDPCYHPGLPPPFAYHDHILPGAPGLGETGTAGNYLGPWKIIVLLYNPAFSNRTDFQPITWAKDIDPAEAAGEFLQINPDPLGNPYEIDTGTLLICPLVSSHG